MISRISAIVSSILFVYFWCKGSAQLQLLKVTDAAGEAVQVSIPKGIIGVVLGVLIIIAAAIRYRKVKAVES